MIKFAQPMYMPTSFFNLGWKNDSHYMDISALLIGLKISARFSQIGLEFSVWEELAEALFM